MSKHKCNICGATSSSEWYTCVVCGEELCDECAIECDKCGGMYCINKCGDDFYGPEKYHFCNNCK
ncbi:MAG: hypothetical protein ACTSU2_16615 [Promethearchaeota archaeon]